MRQNEDTRAEIFQDVERCMPENVYFRQPQTQAMLLDVLFIYNKLNPDVGYRQGMHEILAPILWVISRDAIDHEGLDRTEKFDDSGRSPGRNKFVDAMSINNDKITDKAQEQQLMFSCLDQQFIEHDSFTLFGIIMQTVKSFYETSQESPGITGSSGSSIAQRSKRIHEDYLRRADPELAEHLTTIEIIPQIFLIRWIRLLLGREFPFEGVLNLWDALFAVDPSLSLVDLVCVAMLLRIRWQCRHICFPCFYLD